MIRIGLTGGIGSGKSLVCSVFERLDIPVYNADKEAKKFLNQHEVINKIVSQFGEAVLSEDKTEINRKKLAELVFADKNYLNTLNSIIHPLVLQDFKLWCSKQSALYVVQEAAILFESGFNKFVDKIILVKAPADIRVQRVMLRDGIAQKDVLARMQNQFPENTIESMVDYVIDNSGTALLLPQIIEIHNELVALGEKIS